MTWNRDLVCPREVPKECEGDCGRPATHTIQFESYGPRVADLCCNHAGHEEGCAPMTEPCGSEVPVEINVSGRFIRASMSGPAESPEVEVTFVNRGTLGAGVCNYGHELTTVEEESLREDAADDFLQSLADEAEYASQGDV